MSVLLKLTANLIIITLVAHTATASGELRYDSIRARLSLSGMTDCWSAMLELRSCTEEIVSFFLNGEASYLSPECCNAIRVINRECWPSMLTTIGFTIKEGEILRTFCDVGDTPLQPPAPGPCVCPPTKEG